MAGSIRVGVKGRGAAGVAHRKQANGDNLGADSVDSRRVVLCGVFDAPNGGLCRDRLRISLRLVFLFSAPGSPQPVLSELYTPEGQAKARAAQRTQAAEIVELERQLKLVNEEIASTDPTATQMLKKLTDRQREISEQLKILRREKIRLGYIPHREEPPAPAQCVSRLSSCWRWTTLRPCLPRA